MLSASHTLKGSQKAEAEARRQGSGADAENKRRPVVAVVEGALWELLAFGYDNDLP